MQPIWGRMSRMPEIAGLILVIGVGWFLWGILGVGETAKVRSAVAASGAVIESENPWKLVLPVQWPSDAITSVSPMRNVACMILLSEPGGSVPGFAGSGLSLKRISMTTSASSALR